MDSEINKMRQQKITTVMLGTLNRAPIQEGRRGLNLLASLRAAHGLEVARLTE
jgi:hypothetical protein